MTGERSFTYTIYIINIKNRVIIYLKINSTLLNDFKFVYYYIYVLQSDRDKNFYVGYTENLKSRFKEHCNGRVNSTKNRKPLKLIYSECCLDKKDATHRERYLKTYLGKQFLRNRLKSYLTG